MVARTATLGTLRDSIVRSGGGFLRNVKWLQFQTCRVCAGVTKDGWPTCWHCHQTEGLLGAADRLGFVTYAWPGGQVGRTMYTYKAVPPGPTSRSLVASLMAYAVVAHWDCLVGPEHVPPAGWAAVPSLRGRTGAHPLAEIGNSFLGSLPHVPVQASAVVESPRSLRPTNFVVPRRVPQHVLVLEDTWVTGAHVQSVAGALKASGAETVTVMTVARWLHPDFAETGRFIEGLRSDFDPDLCPFTGERC